MRIFVTLFLSLLLAFCATTRKSKSKRDGKNPVAQALDKVELEEPVPSPSDLEIKDLAAEGTEYDGVYGITIALTPDVEATHVKFYACNDSYVCNPTEESPGE